VAAILSQNASAWKPFQLATKAESEAVRAIKEMFDRDFGKATQPVEGSLTHGISEQLADLFRGYVGNTLGAEIARCAAAPRSRIDMAQGRRISIDGPRRHHSSARQGVNLRLGELDDP
jgi:hypothetical protein